MGGIRRCTWKRRSRAWATAGVASVVLVASSATPAAAAAARVSPASVQGECAPGTTRWWHSPTPAQRRIVQVFSEKRASCSRTPEAK